MLHAMEGETRMETTDGGNRPVGADGSRTNALQHGLTATKCLPKILHPGRLAELVASLQAEYRPHMVTEELLVREAARHAAMLEITEVAEPAVMRTAAQALAQLASSEHTADAEDLQLAAAITTEPLDRAARYRRGHEKALHQALEKLRNLQVAGAAPHPEPAPDWTAQFMTTAGCEAYLQRRFLSAGWRCPRCQRQHGHWLRTRQRWECAECGAQIGLRHGTVFEHSRLPLTSWFLAIRAFAGHTSITARELMQLTDIRRREPCKQCAGGSSTPSTKTTSPRGWQA